MNITRATQSKIHIARKELGLDDDVYRQVLRNSAGSTSTKGMTEQQGQAALDEFKRLGWTPTRNPKKSKGKPHNFDRMPQMIEKIEALLADMQLPWSYADSIANRMWGRQRIAWTTEPEKLKAILVALHNEKEKRALLVNVAVLMATLGPTDPKWQKLLDKQRKGWKRHIPTLRRLVNTLSQAVNALEEDQNVDGR